MQCPGDGAGASPWDNDVSPMSQLTADIREMLSELVVYRELLLRLTIRDLLLRYKQTVMGFAWALFMPLVNTAVFSVIFMRVAPLDTGLPYPVFAACGLLAWNFTASSLRFSVTSLTGNPNMVTKVYFPREIFPFSALVVCAIDSLVASVLLIGLMVYYRIAPGAAMLALPAVILVHVMFTAAVALLVSMANLFYRDVKYLFEVVLTLWMFASSVLYPVELVGGRMSSLLRLNPMTPILDAYRGTLLTNTLPGRAFAVAGVVSVLALAIAWLSFHRAEYEFAENI